MGGFRFDSWHTWLRDRGLSIYGVGAKGRIRLRRRAVNPFAGKGLRGYRWRRRPMIKTLNALYGAGYNARLLVKGRTSRAIVLVACVTLACTYQDGGHGFCLAELPPGKPFECIWNYETAGQPRCKQHGYGITDMKPAIGRDVAPASADPMFHKRY